MPVFNVTVEVTVQQDIYVEANNHDEAEHYAKQSLASKPIRVPPQHTTGFSFTNIERKPDNVVCTKSYGDFVEWNSREEAMRHFFEAMMATEGAESERYKCIYGQLQCGCAVCRDDL